MAKSSHSMRRNQPLVTDDRLATYRDLVGGKKTALAPVSDDAMWRMLHELRNASELEPFGVYLVGSRLEPGRDSADVDLILSPTPGLPFSDIRIERALLCCRAHGLYRASPPCLIDPTFRREGPSFQMAPLPPDRILESAKLFSPKIAGLIGEKRITRYRRFGRFSIEYWREAGEAGFYSKLPQLPHARGARYLRPAVPVTKQ